MSKDSIFTKIRKGEIPGDIIYEDNDFFALLDIKPVNKGHVLVIPKEQHKDIFDMPEDEAAKYMKVVKKISQAVMDATNCDGVNLLMNNKPASGQIIYHAHIHVIPRFEGDGLQHWPGIQYESEDKKKEYASNIKKKLE